MRHWRNTLDDAYKRAQMKLRKRQTSHKAGKKAPRGHQIKQSASLMANLKRWKKNTDHLAFAATQVESKPGRKLLNGGADRRRRWAPKIRALKFSKAWVDPDSAEMEKRWGSETKKWNRYCYKKCAGTAGPCKYCRSGVCCMRGSAVKGMGCDGSNGGIGSSSSR